MTLKINPLELGFQSFDGGLNLLWAVPPRYDIETERVKFPNMDVLLIPLNQVLILIHRRQDFSAPEELTEEPGEQHSQNNQRENEENPGEHAEPFGTELRWMN